MDRKRATAFVACIFFSLVFFTLPPVQIPYLDEKGSYYLENTLKKLVITYAAVRGLNAAVSVVKDSEIDIAPGGVGATIAAGEVVDPLDDLIERFSSVLLFSIVSVGLQKVVMFISVDLFFKFLAVVLLILSVFLLQKKEFLLRIAFKLLAAAVIFRLFVPFTAVVNDFIYEGYFKKDVERAKEQITQLKQILENSQERLTDLKNIKEKVQKIKDYSSGVINGILVLLTAFVVQTIVIPVFIVFVTFKFVGRLFHF